MTKNAASSFFYGPADVVELFRHRAEHKPDEKAFIYLVDGENVEQSLTFGELDRQARAIAAWLQALQLQGERVLLLYPPGLEFISAFLGCLAAGVVAVTAYPPRKNRSLERIQAIVEDADAHVALTISTVLERIQPWLDEKPVLKNLQWLASDFVEPGIEDEWQMPHIHARTLAFLQYTSGSTGTPKGVMLTHGNLTHNCSLIYHAFEHTRTSSGAFWVPSYHDMGLVGGILEPLYIANTNVILSPMAFLQRPLRWLQAISRYRVTTSGGPNFAYDLCVRKISPDERDTLDLSCWRVAFNGAEPVRAETLNRFAEYFAPCGFRREAFYPCYGLAESTLLVTGGSSFKSPVIRSFLESGLEIGKALPATPDEENVRDLVSSGRELPEQKMCIVDPDTLEKKAEGEIGEIWVSGPSVAQGYWKRHEENRHTFGATIAGTTEPKFLRTGDLGFVCDGELFVTGRIKDLIIVRGVNHYPQDIEHTVEQSHSGVRQNAGAAFSLEIDGEAYLVVAQEIERSHIRAPGELFDAIRSRVAADHELALDGLVLLKPGSIPKTSSGKIQRHACRLGLLEGDLHVVAQWFRPGTALAEQFGQTSDAPADDSAESPVTGVPMEGPHWQTVAMPQPVNGNGHYGNGANGNGRRANVASGRTETRRGSEAPAVTEADPESAAAVAAPTGALSGRQLPPDVPDQVVRLVRSLVPDLAGRVTLEVSLADLGLDSLARIELQSKIEDQFGGRFPEQAAMEIETIGDIVSAVQTHLGHVPGEKSPQEIPEEYYRFEQFPEYRKHRQNRERLESAGFGNPFFSVHEGITGDTTIIRGRRLINFSNYNYIGMSGDPQVTRAAQEAVAQYGTSVSASRLVSGEKPLHRELEQAIAEFIGVEDAIVFVGGHSTNETTIGHLFGPGDLSLHDALAHNSIMQGCILSGARRRPFPHNDWCALDRVLSDLRGQHRRVLVAIEGVYSMDGDIADLPRFIEVKNRHKSLLMVDEAHSAGTLGRRGRGIAEHFQLDPRQVDLWMGTLSKSYASCGGYIAGNEALVEYLKYTAPGFVFSVGITPSNAAASLQALRVLESEPERVLRLQANSRLFLQLARNYGLNTGLSQGTPVVPIIIGNSMHALQASRGLFERGINVQPILYPAVEESAARLRFFISSLHSEEQIRYTIVAMADVLSRIDANYVRRPALTGGASMADYPTMARS